MLGLFVAARRRTDDADDTRRSMARAVVVCVALLVPMHLLEPYFTTTGLPQLIFALAALAIGSNGASRRSPGTRWPTSG
jgi:hypothetical protein